MEIQDYDKIYRGGFNEINDAGIGKYLNNNKI